MNDYSEEQIKTLQVEMAKLQRELRETKAQLLHNLHFSSATLDKFSTDKCMGSAVIVTIEALGGRLKIEPTAIRDGLSKETIQALKHDMARSFELSTQLKPKA